MLWLLSSGPFFSRFMIISCCIILMHLVKWSALFCLCCFRLLSISGSCTFIILRVFLFFLKDPADKRRIICDDKLKELFEVDSFNGFTVSKLLSSHFIKTEQWVAYMYITWAHQKWEILLELNLPFSISLWQPVCSSLKKWK